MLYLEHSPGPQLAPFIRKLWYVCSPGVLSGCERVLPTGNAQLILNLASDHCTGFTATGDRIPQSPTLLVGAQTSAQLIAVSDLAELIGVVFRPGGLRCFFPEPADRFSFAETPLDTVWRQAASLRNQLRQAATPAARFTLLERALLSRLNPRPRNPAVQHALSLIHRAAPGLTVAGLARTTGRSPRRLSSLFREEVGLTPKTYLRLTRFNRALRSLHAGCDLPWAELALACGYTDQPHFSNDFHSFSGITPTTYIRSQRPWTNHLTIA